jgi:hypothetical protein
MRLSAEACGGTSRPRYPNELSAGSFYPGDRMRREVIANLASHANVDEGTTDQGRPLVVVTFFGEATGERVEIARIALGPEGAGRLADALLDAARKVRSDQSDGSEA